MNVTKQLRYLAEDSLWSVFHKQPFFREFITVRRMLLALNHDNAEKTQRLGRAYLAAETQSSRVVTVLARAMSNPDQFQQALNMIEDYHATYGAPPEMLEAGLSLANGLGGREELSKWINLVLSVDPKSMAALTNLYQEQTRSGDEEGARHTALRFGYRRHKPIRPAFNGIFHCLRSGEREQARSLLSKMEARKELAYERMMVSAFLDLDEGDIAKSANMVTSAAQSSPSDRRSAPVLSALAKAHDLQNGPTDSETATEFKNWADSVYRQPVSTTSRETLDFFKDKISEVLASPHSIELLESQPYFVSIICPVHRAQDIENIVHQVTRQSWRNAEVVFYPNGKVTKSDILEVWDPACGIEMVMVDEDDPPVLGGILNEAIDASRGDFICRMDADCWYFPDYVANMICCLEFTGADIAVKGTHFRYLEALGTITLNTTGPSFEPALLRKTGSGGTFVFRRSVFEKVRFEQTPAGEDTWFLAASQKEGFKLHYVDPFNFVGVRAEDKSDHAWKIPDAQILFQRKCEVFRNDDDFLRLVRFPGRPE